MQHPFYTPISKALTLKLQLTTIPITPTTYGAFQILLTLQGSLNTVQLNTGKLEKTVMLLLAM
jgi:hypothetical protein